MYVMFVQTLMEKVVILSLATGQKFISASLARLVKIYAELLVSQGLLVTAMEYLSLVPADQSSLELSILQDRIYGSGKGMSSYRSLNVCQHRSIYIDDVLVIRC